MENVLTILFNVESEGYQAYMGIKKQPIMPQYTVLQGALVKKNGNIISTIDSFTSGMDSSDDALAGGLIGGLIGILGGPLGILLGGMTGHLIGSAKDIDDVDRNNTMLETVGSKLEDGEVAILLDAALVQDEVEEAMRVEKELADEARRKMHAERSAERKQKMEAERAKLKANFEALKTKFKKS